jgi:YVTN family beta-propeller protein
MRPGNESADEALPRYEQSITEEEVVMFFKIRSGLTRLILASLLLSLASAPALAGTRAYIGNFKDNTVSVLDADSGKVVATIPVSAGPHGMALTLDGRRLFVTGDGSSKLDVIDTDNNRVIRTIEVGKAPNGVALSPDGRLLLVTVNGDDRVDFIDTITEAVVGTVEVPKPHTVSIRPDGKAAYVTSQEPGRFALVLIGLDSRSVLRTIALDKTPRDLEIGYDGRAVYFTEAGVNAIEVLDPASDRTVAEIPTGVSPHYVNFFRGTTFGMTVVQGPGELLLFDPLTNKPVRSIPVGKQPHWAAVSGDGRTAFVTNEGSNSLSVVDLANGKTTTVPVGNAPRKVVVQRQETARTRVTIDNFAFTPAVATIDAGESLTWSNMDGAPHQIGFQDGASGSDALFPGKSYSRTFDKPGSYEYFCTFHKFMTGRIVVKAR